MIETPCAECLESAALLTAQSGATLCEACAAQFYGPCARCGALVAHDEAALRDGAACCPTCFARPEAESGAEPLGEDELAALVSEFVSLHAEHKKLGEQLEAIKERLKSHAATQPRTANAVLMRVGEYTVKCGYATRVSYDSEKVSAVEMMLDAESFAALFTREVKYNPNKEVVEEFLARADEETAEARAALLAAAERKETATITLVAAKSGTGKTPKKAPKSSAKQPAGQPAEQTAE
jgi:hypothetical protein